MNRRRTRLGVGLSFGLLLALAGPSSVSAKDRDPDVGKSYRVPYRLTATNHFLVRVRVNGKGPFNFLVDTGAPALYVATKTARTVGLEPVKGDFWTPVDRLDFEGGAHLSALKARVEDPFQLVGMNALGLPGTSIDGILGFTILARFKLELDPTKDRMVWTRLDFEPKEPPIPRRDDVHGPPAEVQAMNLLGPAAKLMAALIGKQPEEQLHPRGFLGIELAEDDGEHPVRITRVLPDSPAAKAGVKSGDRLVRLLGDNVTSLRAARSAFEEIEPGEQVSLVVRRGETTETLTATAGEGL